MFIVSHNVHVFIKAKKPMTDISYQSSRSAVSIAAHLLFRRVLPSLKWILSESQLSYFSQNLETSAWTQFVIFLYIH